MSTKEEIREAVINGLEKVTSKEDVTLNDDDQFDDYGLDSLDRMSLMIEVEKLLEADFDQLDPGQLTSINAYIETVERL